MNETHKRHHVLRSTGAVLAGLLVIVVFSIGTDIVMYATGVFPSQGQPMADPLWLIPTAYRFIYGVLGCYVAARLAPPTPEGSPMRHAMILGAIGVALGIIGFLATLSQGPELGPKWYSIAVFAMALPCAWLGGKVESIRRGTLMKGAQT